MVSLREHFPFECVCSDMNYRTIDLWEDQSFHLVDVPSENNINIKLDIHLARYINLNKMNLPVGPDLNVLVLNCGEGLAGTTVLSLLGCKNVTFVDSSEIKVTQCTWANIAMNATMHMGSVRCLSVAAGESQSVLTASVDRTSSTAVTLLLWEEAGVQKYDLVLVLEPVLTPAHWLQLRDVLQRRVVPGGVALLACQSKCIPPVTATVSGVSVGSVTVPVPWTSAAAQGQEQVQERQNSWTAECTLEQTTLLSDIDMQNEGLAVLRLVRGMHGGEL